MRIANDGKGLIRMLPNTRIRLIPLLLLGLSGAAFAQSLPTLQVAPDLLRPAPTATPARATTPVPASAAQASKVPAPEPMSAPAPLAAPTPQPA
ncbi:MAG: hypothetical protein KDF55_04280, partial [Thauera sp.]|nr:hypothetical protein [Thauera sp.]